MFSAMTRHFIDIYLFISVPRNWNWKVGVEPVMDWCSNDSSLLYTTKAGISNSLLSLAWRRIKKKQHDWLTECIVNYLFTVGCMLVLNLSVLFKAVQKEVFFMIVCVCECTPLHTKSNASKYVGTGEIYEQRILATIA